MAAITICSDLGAPKLLSLKPRPPTHGSLDFKGWNEGNSEPRSHAGNSQSWQQEQTTVLPTCSLASLLMLVPGTYSPFPWASQVQCPQPLSPQRGNSEGTTLGNPCTEVARKESRGEALGSTLFWDVRSPQTQSGTLPKLQAEAGTLPSAELILPTSDQNVHIP